MLLAPSRRIGRAAVRGLTPGTITERPARGSRLMLYNMGREGARFIAACARRFFECPATHRRLEPKLVVGKPLGNTLLRFCAVVAGVCRLPLALKMTTCGTTSRSQNIFCDTTCLVTLCNTTLLTAEPVPHIVPASSAQAVSFTRSTMPPSITRRRAAVMSHDGSPSSAIMYALRRRNRRRLRKRNVHDHA